MALDQKVVINFFFSNKNRHPKYSNRSSSWWATLKEFLTRAVSLNYDSATCSAHALLVQDLKAVFSKGMLTFCCGDIRVLSVALVYNSSVFFLLECNFFSSIRDSTSSLSGGHHSLQKILQYLMNMDEKKLHPITIVGYTSQILVEVIFARPASWLRIEEKGRYCLWWIGIWIEKK